MWFTAMINHCFIYTCTGVAYDSKKENGSRTHITEVNAEQIYNQDGPQNDRRRNFQGVVSGLREVGFKLKRQATEVIVLLVINM